jgi:formylmethanofuran dehydrogenase subunit B
MYKIKNVICPGCGKIEEKEEIDFLENVIQGNIKEECLLINEKFINGLQFCAVCR